MLPSLMPSEETGETGVRTCIVTAPTVKTRHTFNEAGVAPTNSTTAMHATKAYREPALG